MRGKATFRERSDVPEMHARRRREILRAHPEIRKLFGIDRNIAWVTLAVVCAQLATTYAVVRADRWWLTIVVAYFVGSILNHWLAMSIHETSHDLAFRSKLANKLLALFANGPFVFPMAMTFHRYHVEHHVLLGVEGEDTDLPVAFEQRMIGASRLRKFFWLLFYIVVYTARGLTFLRPLDRWERLNIGTQLAATIALLAAFGWHGVGYLVLSTFFGMSLHPVAAHFIHEHYTFAEGQETYSYYGPLNHVTFNVGYHVEHHDFMNVPGSRLPELHRIAAPYYTSLVSHRSWTWVLWHFVTSPMTLGHRIVRDAALAPRRRPTAERITLGSEGGRDVRASVSRAG